MAAAASLLAPLIAARVTATADDDGHLLVRPAAWITPDLRVYIRTHRDELIAELSKSVEILLSEALHHPPCPSCGSTTASMLRAGDAPPRYAPDVLHLGRPDAAIGGRCD